jgi:site-specific DNA-methyltransferase (adenine-specific)
MSKGKTSHPSRIPLPLVEMLIKSCTRPKDDCLILSGGRGNELLLCRELERNFISSETHPDRYCLINQRLAAADQDANSYQERKDNGSA